MYSHNHLKAVHLLIVAAILTHGGEHASSVHLQIPFIDVDKSLNGTLITSQRK